VSGYGTYVSVAGVPALYVGICLFVAGAAVVIWRMHVALERGADEARTLTVAAAALAILAFAFLTRMHERYMFYSLAFLVPLVFLRQLRWAFGALCGLFVLNLWWVYAYSNSRGDQGHPCALPFPGCVGFDSLFGGFANDTWQKKFWSGAVTAIALIIAWFGIRWAQRSTSLPGLPAAPAGGALCYSMETSLRVGASTAADRQTNTRSGGAALSDSPAD
jgi:apolipoprotein N-acyltransferase